MPEAVFAVLSEKTRTMANLVEMTLNNDLKHLLSSEDSGMMEYDVFYGI